jgi:hypothetical protein
LVASIFQQRAEFDMDWGAIAFWGFAAIVSVAVTYSSYRSGLEAEKTIRLAIERGVPLDNQTLLALKARATWPIPAHLVVAGIICISLAVGVALFTYFIRAEEADAVLPLVGISALCLCVGLGLLIAGAWLMRTPDRGAA